MTEKSLWEFSVALYARPGVEEACLTLQDRHGLDVNLVMLALWLAASGRGEGFPAAAVGIAAAWHVTVVGVLRGLRQRLKTAVPPAEGLRAEVKAAELAAERVLQERLGALAPARRSSPASSPASSRTGAVADAGRRLEIYMHLLGRRPKLPQRALTALLAGTFPTATTAALQDTVRRLSVEVG
jgi:uncharacterized protein (TIGR02444 family)